VSPKIAPSGALHMSVSWPRWLPNETGDGPITAYILEVNLNKELVIRFNFTST